MVHKFLKIGGVSSVEEFYKKFPDEATFFNMHPEAKQMLKSGGESDDFYMEHQDAQRLRDLTPINFVPVPYEIGGVVNPMDYFYGYGGDSNGPLGYFQDGGPRSTATDFYTSNPNEYAKRMQMYNDSLKYNKEAIENKLKTDKQNTNDIFTPIGHVPYNYAPKEVHNYIKPAFYEKNDEDYYGSVRDEVFDNKAFRPEGFDMTSIYDPQRKESRIAYSATYKKPTQNVHYTQQASKKTVPAASNKVEVPTPKQKPDGTMMIKQPSAPTKYTTTDRAGNKYYFVNEKPVSEQEYNTRYSKVSEVPAFELGGNYDYPTPYSYNSQLPVMQITNEPQGEMTMYPNLSQVPVMSIGGNTPYGYGAFPAMQRGGTSSLDSLAHQAGKTMDYEYRKGSAQGTRLSNYGNPALGDYPSKKQAVDWYMQNIAPNPILGYFSTAMEKGEAGDFLYNTGRDPRIYILDQYLKSKGQSGLPNRGSYNKDTKTSAWTPELKKSLDDQWNLYKDDIAKLSENDRRTLMNNGKKFYYMNTYNDKNNYGVPGIDYWSKTKTPDKNKKYYFDSSNNFYYEYGPDNSLSPAYGKTWKPRIEEAVNTYEYGGSNDGSKWGLKLSNKEVVDYGMKGYFPSDLSAQDIKRIQSINPDAVPTNKVWHYKNDAGNTMGARVVPGKTKIGQDYATIRYSLDPSEGTLLNPIHPNDSTDWQYVPGGPSLNDEITRLNKLNVKAYGGSNDGSKWGLNLSNKEVVDYGMKGYYPSDLTAQDIKRIQSVNPNAVPTNKVWHYTNEFGNTMGARMVPGKTAIGQNYATIRYSLDPSQGTLINPIHANDSIDWQKTPWGGSLSDEIARLNKLNVHAYGGDIKSTLRNLAKKQYGGLNEEGGVKNITNTLAGKNKFFTNYIKNQTAMAVADEVADEFKAMHQEMMKMGGGLKRYQIAGEVDETAPEVEQFWNNQLGNNATRSEFSNQRPVQWEQSTPTGTFDATGKQLTGPYGQMPTADPYFSTQSPYSQNTIQTGTNQQTPTYTGYASNTVHQGDIENPGSFLLWDKNDITRPNYDKAAAFRQGDANVQMSQNQMRTDAPQQQKSQSQGQGSTFTMSTPSGEDMAQGIIGSIQKMTNRIQAKERKRQEQKNAYKQSGDYIMPTLPPLSQSRGDYEINSGDFRPNQMVPVQYAGIPQGNIGYGQYYAKFGGSGFKENDEVYMSDEDIQNFLKSGGQLEFLD